MGSDDEALAIICGWEWEHYKSGQQTRTLSETINDLALTGFVGADKAVLSLLADGKLEAQGRCDWAKSQNGEFRKSGYFAIHPRHWQALKEGLAIWHPIKGPYVKFHSLEWDSGFEDEHPIASWQWENNHFQTHQQAGEFLDIYYLEEAFVAYDIAIVAPTTGISTLPEERAASSVPTDKVNKGGRNPTYDWERAIAALIFQWADKGDWQPLKQADVVKALAEWFAEQGATPSDSLLKQRAQWLFREFESRNPDGQ